VATSPVMDLLEQGVPITLLCDLATFRDPDSMTICLSERPKGDLLAQESTDQRSANPPSTAQIWPVTYIDVVNA
jgi:hypothetical protein